MAPTSHLDGPRAPPRWKCRWIAWRNRVLASQRFQDGAARIPLLRGTARRRAGQLFDLLAGFTYSQILAAAIETRLLDLLQRGPADSEAIARHTGLSVDAAIRLARAAASLGLAEAVSPGWWALGQQGAALQANPGVQAMIRHHRLLYADLADPVALLRADRREPTRLSGFWHYAGGDSAEEYSALMAQSQDMVARQAIAAHDFTQHRRLLDVGGGHGAFACALADRPAAPAIGLFDLPPVIAGAAAAIARRGHGGRIALHEGDIFATPLPEGYDCATLVRILHDHDDGPCLAILRAVHQALPPGGTLVIAEPMAGSTGALAMGDGYFGLYLWAMNSGRPRTPREYRKLLQAAGFRAIRTRSTTQPMIASVVVSTA